MNVPACVQRYLDHRTPEGQRNAALFSASCQLRDARWPFDLAVATLAPAARRDGLGEPEATSTMRSAYRGAAREPARGSGARDFTPAPPAQAKPQEPTPPPMGDALRAAAREGFECLATDPKLAGIIAAWRGWPEAFVRGLAEDRIMGAPQMGHGRRAVAFPVYREGKAGAIPVGLHCRPFPADEGTWFYAPRGTRPLPMIFGDFRTARLLVICEGEWDMLSWCLAAGWLSHDAAWPDDGVAAVGVPGCGAWRCLMGARRHSWPADPPPNCLLVCDGDRAGESWRDGPGETFFSALAGACRRVEAFRPEPPAKDLNDLCRAGRLTAGAVNGILREVGFIDREGRVL